MHVLAQLQVGHMPDARAHGYTNEAWQIKALRDREAAGGMCRRACPEGIRVVCRDTPTWARGTVVSKLITDRHFPWEELISNYRYRIALSEELIFITETDLWDFQQKIFHYRYIFSLEFQLVPLSIQISGSKQMSSVIKSATTGTSVRVRIPKKAHQVIFDFYTQFRTSKISSVRMSASMVLKQMHVYRGQTLEELLFNCPTQNWMTQFFLEN